MEPGGNMLNQLLTATAVSAALFIINAEAEPGGTYTLTGNEKSLTEVIQADMQNHVELYKGESLSSYTKKFKKENQIGKRKLNPGDELVFPETMASLKAKKAGAAQSAAYAEIYCKLKSEKFRDGVELFSDNKINAELINIPEKFADLKMTVRKFGVHDPIQFEVRKAGPVLIAVHFGCTDPYEDTGWKQVEHKIEALQDGKGQALYQVWEKHHDVGTYSLEVSNFSWPTNLLL